MAIISYLLFFLAGVGFGYAAPGRLKWIPLVFPLVLALGAVVKNGVGGAVIIRLLIALAITVAGVLVGRMLDERGRRREAAAA